MYLSNQYSYLSKKVNHKKCVENVWRNIHTTISLELKKYFMKKKEYEYLGVRRFLQTFWTMIVSELVCISK